MSTEERADLTCDCYDGELSLWGPACKTFNDDDTGRCLDCGHMKECHDNP